MRRTIVILGALTLVAAGCGDSGPESPQGRVQSGDMRVDAFATTMQGPQHDYQPFASPSALGEEADLAVTGTITEVRPGQSYAETPGVPPVYATSVLEVDVETILLGARPLVSDGAVFIEIAHPAFVARGEVETDVEMVPFDHEAFAATVPVGAHGAFFLDDRTDEHYLPTVIDEGAGRPAGASLMATFVQGFLLEDANGALVSVNESIDAMPSGWHHLMTLEDVIAQVASGAS